MKKERKDMFVTIDQVKDKAAKAYSKGDYNRLKERSKVAVFIRPTPLKAGTALPIGTHKYKVEQDSYLVYIDLLHESKTAHPVMYELHNTNNGFIKTIEEESLISDPELQDSLESFILPEAEN